MENFLRDILRYADHMGPQQWLLVLICVIVVGAFFLRGFGSRSEF